jgi:hypothetical protein
MLYVVAFSQIKFRKLLFVFLLSSAALAQDAILAGTILPVQLNSSLKSTKLHAGQTVTARIMQDVPLGKTRIRAGAKVVGHVVAVQPATATGGAQVSLRFDTIVQGKRAIHVETNLRAFASMMDVAEAQVPDSGPDRGTSEYYWTTNQIGGEVQYRGGGAVTHGSDVVGRTVPDGVLVRPAAKPGTPCRGVADGNDNPQAMWVFSSDACGMYDLPNVRLVHAGRTEPRGVITLQSQKGALNIPAGSGLLLRVNSSSE